MNVPAFVNAILTAFEKRTTPFREGELFGALESAASGVGELSDDERSGFVAESHAFFFSPRGGHDSIWGTYFSPAQTFFNPELGGEALYIPDVATMGSDVIVHWEKRAKECTHPVMKARYADLVWDLTRKIAGKSPSPDYARIAIDSYSDAVKRNLHKNMSSGQGMLNRAAELSQRLKDAERTAKIINEMFVFSERMADPKKIASWVFLFDSVYGQKCLSAEQEAKIISELEKQLALVSNPENRELFSQFAADKASERLVHHYRRKGAAEDVQRVTLSYGKAVEHACREASSLLAIGWLQPVIEAYHQAGMKQDEERAKLLSLDKGKDVEKEMKVISASFSVNAEEVEAHLNALTSGGLHDALIRTCTNLIPNVETARTTLDWVSKNLPLQANIGIGKLGNGQIIAKQGSISDDPDGRLVGQVAQNIALLQWWLARGLKRIVEQYDPTPDEIIDVLYESPVFLDDSRQLLYEGLKAYFLEDFVKAIHVLVPQVEATFRNVLTKLRIPTTRLVKGNSGITQVKNINEILSEERVKNLVGEDLWRYWQVFLADRRGFNLRNRVAHGLVTLPELNYLMANQVLHTLVTLSLIRGDDLQNASTEAGQVGS